MTRLNEIEARIGDNKERDTSGWRFLTSQTVVPLADLRYLLTVARAAERIYETLRVGNRVSQAQRDALRAALEGAKP